MYISVREVVTREENNTSYIARKISYQTKRESGPEYYFIYYTSIRLEGTSAHKEIQLIAFILFYSGNGIYENFRILSPPPASYSGEAWDFRDA